MESVLDVLLAHEVGVGRGALVSHCARHLATHHLAGELAMVAVLSHRIAFFLVQGPVFWGCDLAWLVGVWILLFTVCWT